METPGNSDLPMNLSTNLTAIEKFIRLLTDMRKRDLLLVGFVGLSVLSFGVLTGYIPSPVLTVLAKQEELEEQNAALIELTKLHLYLARETCLHTADTEIESARCDRQSIRDAILGDILPAENQSKPIE